MRGLVCLGVFAALLAVAHGWSKYFDSYDTWSPSRRSYGLKECVKSGSKCFSSPECCKGYVCAAFDDLFGLNPEIPGYCVREKDLHPCHDHRDCDPGDKCFRLGRNKEKYCVVKPEDEEEVEVVEQLLAPKSNPKFNKFPKDKVGLGAACEDDSDCAAYTADGKHQLCCQDVRRYRQKARRICDRVTPISKCLTSRK